MSEKLAAVAPPEDFARRWRDAYVVFDNDAPLFVCLTKANAEEVLKIEKQRLEQDLLESIERLHSQGLLSSQQYQQDKQRAEDQLNKHFLHYSIVPFAPSSRSEGGHGFNPGRRRGSSHGT